MKKPESPTPDKWTPEVAKHVQGYLECMTLRPWTQGSSTHEVVRHPDGYHVFDCHHGRDGQGAAYIVNAMPAAIAHFSALESRLAEAEKERDALSASVRELEEAVRRVCNALTQHEDGIAAIMGLAARALKGEG